MKLSSPQSSSQDDTHTPANASRLNRLPILAALLLVLLGGIFLLELSERQNRDTTRKHHLEDIEQSLYAARNARGTFPPYNEPTWCGIINAPENHLVQNELEAALRTYNRQYRNEEKPFPQDPHPSQDERDYFYWKRSPSSFELYALLEADPNGSRSTGLCPNSPALAYDYGIASFWREDGSSGPVYYLTPF